MTSPQSFDGVRESYPAVELSHILSRAKYPEYKDKEFNMLPLCPKHHRTGKEAVHTSREWELYYYRFLPDEIIDEIGGFVGVVNIADEINVLF